MGRCTSIGVRTAATGNARPILAAATNRRRPRRSALLPPRFSRATGIWSVASRIGNADAVVLPCWTRSEEETSELQSLLSNSYAVCCVKYNTWYNYFQHKRTYYDEYVHAI